MAKSNLDSAIRDRIDTFVADLTAMVTQQALVAVQEALGAPARRGPGRPRGSGRRRGRKPGRPAGATRAKRVKRSTEQVDAMAVRVYTHVKANPGSRLEQISAALRMPSKVL